MANTTGTVPTTEREHFLATFEREYQTTLRVLKAYPANKVQWKPAERSNSVMQIAWALVLTQLITEPVLMVDKLTPEGLPAPPSDWNVLLSTFEKAHADATKQLTKMSDDVFKSTLVMPVGPGGATAPMRRADALWMFLFDAVHHRGQLSVYVRATGGKVPDIYGGSGDEPWF
jgi:uncharacterized damage-inducible protein DinB